MKVEYKISQRKETSGEITLSGKLYYITFDQGEDPQTGEPIEIPNREKIQEFQFRFPADITDAEITNFLRSFASIYGEVINE
jgi:hypothetical protein